MFNQITLIGRLGNEPEIRTIPNNDKQVANLSLATTHSFKQNGQKQEETEWHSVVVFNGLVSVVQNYLHKGDTVMIQGRLRTRKWQDQHGQDHYKTEVICNELKMMGTKKNGAQNQQNQQNQSYQQPVQSMVNQPARQNNTPQPVQQQPRQSPAPNQPAATYQNQPVMASPEAQHQVDPSLYQQPDQYSQAKDPMF